MAYSVNVLTANGKAVIAGASASNRLIYTRMLTSSDAMTAEDAAAASVSDFEGPEGPIVAASATDNVARVVGVVRNTSTGADPVELRSFALCGRLESATQDAVLLVLSDPVASVILPSSSAPLSGSSVGFSLRIDAGVAAMVTITSAGSATVSDLERMVSCHRAGDATAGDAQNVRGIKMFLDGLGASVLEVEKDDAKGWSGDAAIGGGLLVSGSARVAVDLSVDRDISTGGTVAPQETNTGAVGTYDAQYKRGFIGGFSLVSNPSGNPAQTVAQLGLPNTATNNPDYLQFRKVTNTGTRYLETKCGTIRIDLSSRGLVSDDSLSLQVGSNTLLELSNGSSGHEFTFRRPVIFENDVYMTASDMYVNYIECNSIYAGNPSTFADLVTVAGLFGTQPSYDSGTSARSLKVGSIVLASYANFTARKTGEIMDFTSSASSLLYFAETSGGTISATAVKLPYGKYVPLCDVSGVNGWALFQCIALY